jgi:hypothetical protein
LIVPVAAVAETVAVSRIPVTRELFKTGLVSVLFVSVLTDVKVKPTDAALLAALVALVAALVADVDAADA